MLVKIGLVLSTLTVCFARTTWKDLEKYTFEQYIQEYGFNWREGSTEWSARKFIFEAELSRIREHNMGEHSWKMGVNQFTALSDLEMKGYMGRSKGKARAHTPKNLQAWDENVKVQSPQLLPSSIDWRDERVVTPVKDQGRCGSCWAFASASVLEAHIARATGLLYSFSVQQLAMCTPNPEACGGTGACEGSTAELAFDYVAGSGGLYQEYQQGYAAYSGTDSQCTTPSGLPKATISGYGQVPANNYTAMMNALVSLGPLAVNVDATRWKAYESGVYSEAGKPATDINHVVALVGYGIDDTTGKKFWLVKNSWSPSFGEGGYIRVERSDLDETNCGLDTHPQDGVECAGGAEVVRVCGTSGIIYDGVYPVGGRAL